MDLLQAADAIIGSGILRSASPFSDPRLAVLPPSRCFGLEVRAAPFLSCARASACERGGERARAWFVCECV
jgi:hypothetical protein